MLNFVILVYMPYVTTEITAIWPVQGESLVPFDKGLENSFFFFFFFFPPFSPSQSLSSLIG